MPEIHFVTKITDEGVVSTLEKIASAVEGVSEDAEKSGKKTEQAWSEMGKQAALAGAAMAAVGIAIGAALFEMAEQASKTGAVMLDMSKRTGVSTEQMSKLGYAARQNGADMESVVMGLRLLSKHMDDASQGNQKAEGTFNRLGISVKDSTGQLRDNGEVLLDVADKFRTMQDGAAKAALAQELFGRGGLALIPMLNEGRDGIEALSTEAEKLGIVYDRESAEAAHKFEDAQDRLNAATQGLVRTIGAMVMPAFEKLIDFITKAFVATKDFTAAHPQLIDALLTFAGVMTASGGVLVAVGAFLTLLPLLTTAMTALGVAGGPIFLTGTAFAALVTIILTFKEKIASGLLQSLSLAVEGFSKMIGWAAKAADALGMKGISASLKSASDEALSTSSRLTEMGASFESSSGEVIKNTKAVDDWLEKQKTVPTIVNENVEKAKKKLDELLTKNNIALGKMLDDQLDLGNKWIEHEGELWSKAQDTIEKLMQKNAQDLRQHEKQMGEDNERALTYSSGVLDKTLTNNIDMVDNMGKHMTEAYKKSVSDLHDSAGKIFDDMFLKGENVFKSLQSALKGGALSIGRTIFQDVTAQLLGPIKVAFDNFFKGLLEGAGLKSFISGIGAKLGGALAHVFGGGGAGGVSVTSGAGTIIDVLGGGGGAVAGAAGAGGTAGLGSLSAFFTNPWTIAIGASIAAAFAISKIGQGRKTADEFVSGYQNPFGKAITDIYDAETAAIEQGQLTADAAEEAKKKVADLWSTFQTEASTFAQKGKNQAKVVQQAFDTLGPIMQRTLDDMTMRAETLRKAEDAQAGSTDDASKSVDNFTNSTGLMTEGANGAAITVVSLTSAISNLMIGAEAAANAINLAAKQMGTITIAAPAPGPGTLPPPTGGTTTSTTRTTTQVNPFTPPGSSGTGATLGPNDPRLLFAPRGFIPSAAMGATDTGPAAGLWFLHPHERVLSEDENRNYRSGPSSVVHDNRQIYVSVDGSKSPKETAEAVILEIERAMRSNRRGINDTFAKYASK